MLMWGMWHVDSERGKGEGGQPRQQVINQRHDLVTAGLTVWGAIFGSSNASASDVYSSRSLSRCNPRSCGQKHT